MLSTGEFSNTGKQEEENENHQLITDIQEPVLVTPLHLCFLKSGILTSIHAALHPALDLSAFSIFI